MANMPGKSGAGGATPTMHVLARKGINKPSANSMQMVVGSSLIGPSASKVQPSVIYSGSKRPLDSFSENLAHDYNDVKRRRDGKSACRGLRHFSNKVCERLQKKGRSTYNEVADEMVNEFSDPFRCMSPTEQLYDQKNIRRRVYDALNVLMAMNIITKDKKEIKWNGLPSNRVRECDSLVIEKQKRLERVQGKTQQLHELILQQIAYKNLVSRNRTNEKMNGRPSPNACIHLPFIVVSTAKKTVIDCSISNDKTEYLFKFDDTFEINDDIEVLKRMNMAFGLERGECSKENLTTARLLVPKALEKYVIDMASSGEGRLSLKSSIKAGPQGIVTGMTNANTGSGSGDGADMVATGGSHDSGADFELGDCAPHSSAGLSRQSSLSDLMSRGNGSPHYSDEVVGADDDCLSEIEEDSN